MLLHSMTLNDIPPRSKVLVATTTGNTAREILGGFDFDCYVFYQNIVVNNKYFYLSNDNKKYVLSKTRHLYEIPLDYSRSVLSKDYTQSLKEVSEGTKVCFEMMLYALERKLVVPGEVIYAVAKEIPGWDTIVRFKVPKLVDFHNGGYSDFEVWVNTVDKDVDLLIRTLSNRNECLPIIVLYYPKVIKDGSPAWIPYSLLSIASVVDRDKYYVYIVDNNLNDYESCYDELSAISYKVFLVGISCMIGYQIVDMLRFVSEVKAIDPGIPIVVGGSLPTIQPAVVLKHESIDLVVMSQGEQTFLELLNSLDDKEKLKDVLGLGFKEDSHIIVNPLRPIINKEKFPDYPFEIIDIGKYVKAVKELGERTLNYISSQGCPNRCAFCSDSVIYQRRWITKPMERVIREIDYLVNVFSVGSIKIHDSNFMVSESRTVGFCNALLDENLEITWGASIHPGVLSRLKEDTLTIMKKSGCRRLLIGAESGNQKELDLVRKGITVDTIYECARILKKHGIVGTFTIMIGLPFTTHEFIVNSIQMAKDINRIWDRHMVEILVYLPYPGTDLYELAKSGGFVEPSNLQEWGNYAYMKKTSSEKEFAVYIEAIRKTKEGASYERG